MTYRTVRASCVSLIAFALLGCSQQSSLRSAPPSAPSATAVAAPVVFPVAAIAPVADQRFPLPVIELDGSGTDIGSAHAHALGDGIRSLHGRYIASFFKSATKRFIALGAASLFEPRIAPEHRDEIRALAAGTSIDAKQMLLAQCFLDLIPITACSTVTLPASASPDGVARFGRNLDFPSFNLADKASVVLVYRPTGRYAFASIAWPGMVGVLTGMNEHGLTLANMEVKRGPRVPDAMPYTLLYRSVLERCKTVEQAVAFLRETPRQSANNLMLMDAAGHRAVVEITPEEIFVREGEGDAALISTNHQRGADGDTTGRCTRYDLLHDESKSEFGRVDVAEIESMLDGASQGDLTMQSMVFEPANRVVYLATGKNAARGEFHRLDLGRRFQNVPVVASGRE